MNPFEKLEIMYKDDYTFCAESCDLQGAINNLTKCIKHMNTYGHVVYVQEIWQQQLKHFSRQDKSNISSAAIRTE